MLEVLFIGILIVLRGIEAMAYSRWSVMLK
jgi:hypothetical protein